MTLEEVLRSFWNNTKKYVGDKSTLLTTDKSSLVGAINEINDKKIEIVDGKIEKSEDNGVPSVDVTLQDKKLNFNFKNIKGERGAQGEPGARGTGIELMRDGDSIKWRYISVQDINANYGTKANIINAKGYTNSTIRNIAINNLADDLKSARVDKVTITGITAAGKKSLSITPSRALANGAEDEYPYLNGIDPTKKITYPLENNKILIKADTSFKKINDVVLPELLKYVGSDPNPPIRIGFLSIEVSLLNEKEDVMGAITVMYEFLEDIYDDTLSTLINISDLKGKDGASAFDKQGHIVFPDGTTILGVK